MARTNGGLSNHVKDTCRSRADHSTLIKAQLSALNAATEKGTSDKKEATRFSQCAHDQRRRLKVDSIRLISGGRRRIRRPYCLAHARPTMCCICLIISWSTLVSMTPCMHSVHSNSGNIAGSMCIACVVSSMTCVYEEPFTLTSF